MGTTSDGDAAPVHAVVMPGMTLRDWFAGMAMGGMLRFTPRELKTWQELDEWAQSHCVAHLAYRLADEMMQERDEKETA
ncbi:MAG: hypothetical protein FJ308_02140 [Planctomycetes bacterium]|nr:hypothetical protein [Planctomycetota bacterium]